MFRRLALSFAVLPFLWCFACGGEDGTADPSQGSVEITSPEEGAHVGEERVRVKGEASSAIERVEVNGETADVTGGEWEALVEFEPGEVTATATAVDAEEVRDSVDFVVDTEVPEIVLDAPDRGTFVEEEEGNTVTFEGRVTDNADKLRAFALNDEVVEYDDDGNFSHDASLEPGYNEFEVRAADEAGNESSVRRAVMYGPMVDSGAPMDSAFALVADARMYELMTEVIEGFLTPERVTDDVQSATADEEQVDVTEVTFDDLSVDIVPVTDGSGYLEVEVHVTGLEIDGEAHFGDGTYPMTIAIDEAVVTSDVYLEPDGEGDLRVDFEEHQLELESEDLHFEFDGMSEDDLGESERDLLQSVAETAAESAFSELLDDELVEEMYDPGMLHREFEILGRTLEIELEIQHINIRSGETYVDLGAAIVSDRFEEVPEAPGAVQWPGQQLEIPSLERDLLVASHRGTIDRILHGVWHAGLLTLQLGPSDFADFELPIDLNADSLGTFLDADIADLAEGDTPVGLRLRPQLPPVAAMGDQAEKSESDDDVLGMRMGDLLVDIELWPEDGDPIEVATLALFLDAEAVVEADEEGSLNLELGAEARADVAGEPAVELDEEDTEDFVSDMVGIAVEMMGDESELTSEYEVDWLTIRNVEPRVYGEDDDQLSVEAELEADTDAIE
ncbi:MAG: hypothetical protein ACOCV2_01695 [Persicimonas sp.]